MSCNFMFIIYSMFPSQIDFHWDTWHPPSKINSNHLLCLLHQDLNKKQKTYIYIYLHLAPLKTLFFSHCCWIICAPWWLVSKNKILYFPVSARLGCSRCLFIGRRLFDGSPPCLTRMADSEHILIYRAGPPGAPHTGLNTDASRCSETFPALLSPSKWIFNPAFGILGVIWAHSALVGQ